MARRFWMKICVWVVNRLQPEATAWYRRELQTAQEVTIPQLQNKIEVLEKYVENLAEVNARDLKRIAAETAVAAAKIAEKA